MVHDKYLIVGSWPSSSTIGQIDVNQLILQLMNAGMTWYQADQEARRRKAEHDAEMARLAAQQAAGGAGSAGGSISQYLPYIALGAVVLILIMRK